MSNEKYQLLISTTRGSWYYGTGVVRCLEGLGKLIDTNPDFWHNNWTYSFNRSRKLAASGLRQYGNFNR